jgi:hypothetical protein
MSEHTPGPWRYQREDGFNPPFGHEVLFEVYTSTGLYGNPATCKKEGDACLIAAAPDLLEALREAAQHLEEDNALHPDLHPIGQCPVLDLVRSAIAKAEGRS